MRCCILLFSLLLTLNLIAADTLWQAGIATQDITPRSSVWMSGYAHRKHAATGTLQALKVKVLVLKTPAGNTGVFISTDLLGLPRNMSVNICQQLQQQYALERSQIMLTSSHTHTGPVLRNALYDIYPLTDSRKEQIDTYSTWLENRIVETVGLALKDMRPAQLSVGTGVTRFAVNRRTNVEGLMDSNYFLEGPSDHSVPVIQIAAPSGELRGIVFGYACHATVLRRYEWSGDYPGFAQAELERMYPGATALFFAGCGADQNPLPRRSVPLAQQYGRELAAAVSRVLQEDMKPLSPRLATRYKELNLPLDAPPSREELEAIASDTTTFGWRWGARQLRELDEGTATTQAYPHYPLQTWQLGDLTWVAMGGEVVVDYAIYLKRLFGKDLIVTAYANDVMAYIPSLRVLREGGYEGCTSMRVYGLPAAWAPNIELQVLEAIRLQVEQIRQR